MLALTMRLYTIFAVSTLLQFAPLVASSVHDPVSAQAHVDDSITSLLSQAQSHLSRGETHEALELYDAVVARDVTGYLTYFKRATARLSLGRVALASQDFSRALELEPDFEGAHHQLAKIKARHADWEGAKLHYAKAHKLTDSVELLDLAEAQEAAQEVEKSVASSSWEQCAQQANIAILVANRAPSLRLARARCRLETGSLEAAVSDFERVIALTPGNTGAYYNLSAILMYGLGDMQQSMAQARRCLHSDADNTLCRRILKKGKLVEKATEKASRLMEKTPMAATRILVGTSDEPGLIANVKSDLQELAQEGTLSDRVPRRLYATLIGMACQGYHEVREDVCCVSLYLLDHVPVLTNRFIRPKANTRNNTVMRLWSLTICHYMVFCTGPSYWLQPNRTRLPSKFTTKPKKHTATKLSL